MLRQPTAQAHRGGGGPASASSYTVVWTEVRRPPATTLNLMPQVSTTAQALLVLLHPLIDTHARSLANTSAGARWRTWRRRVSTAAHSSPAICTSQRVRCLLRGTATALLCLPFDRQITRGTRTPADVQIQQCRPYVAR